MSGLLPVKGAFLLNQQKSQDVQKKHLREASEMYERHFLNEMVKAMRKTVPEGQGILPGDFAQKLYRDQLDQQHVKAWSKKGGVGLADMIYQQMQEKIFGVSQPMSKPQGPLPINPINGSSIQIEKINTEKGAMNLWLDGKRALNGGKILVTSPWSGRVVKAFQSDEGRAMMKIRHQDGVESILNYQGNVFDLKSGQEVAQGQELGSVDSKVGKLVWMVTKNVAESA